MNFDTFLIKYAEIGVKGKNRYVFEDALVRQIKFSLSKLRVTPVFEISDEERPLTFTENGYQVFKFQGRVLVRCPEGFDYEDTVNALKHVFGIVGICPVLVRELSTYEDLVKDVADYMEGVYGGESFTFKAHARRIDKKYPVLSPQMNMDFGEAVLGRLSGARVDVHEPEISLEVEVRDKAYIYSKVIPGPGGMPVGTAGKAMLLLSGGIDSPVAGYMIGKRGVNLEAVYFHAPPYTSERAKQKVVDLAGLVARYTGPIKLHVINFTDMQLHIYQTCPHDQLTIIMRRYMMKIAQDLAYRSKCLALVTGESIGQVASQTMQSMLVTGAVCSLPVYRPCIGMDKQEIIDRSLLIDTYETSILPYEDCCTIFVAKHPVTKPTLEGIERSERKLGEKMEELYRAAMASDEVIHIK